MVREFIFNGKSSKEFNIIIKKSNHLSLPSKSIESIKVPGRTGNLIIDDGSKENLEIELEVYIDCRKKSLKIIRKEISIWLQDSIGYKELIFDDGVRFNAICSNQLNFGDIATKFPSLLIKFDSVEVD